MLTTDFFLQKAAFWDAVKHNKSASAYALFSLVSEQNYNDL